MKTDDNRDFERWLNAIEAADTWCDPLLRGPKKTGNMKQLAELFRSSVPLSQSVREILAEVLTRHRLKPLTKRAPNYLNSESQINAMVLEEFAKEFAQQRNWPRGPITKAEMKEAARILQQREKGKGRGLRNFEGKAAAQKLRGERLVAFAKHYGLKPKEFRNALAKKHGSINRLKKKSV